jgi:hypothetical protein
MKNPKLSLSILPGKFAVCLLEKNDVIPSWALKSSFFTISKTKDELSVVCSEKSVPQGLKFEGNWKALKVEDKLDFSLTGILSSLINPLAKEKISIFAVSTYNTDYIFVKCNNLKKAKRILNKFSNIKIFD